MKRPLQRSFVTLALAFLSVSRASGAPTGDALEAARRGVAHLASQMDAFHIRFPVYDDVSSAGNHFHALAKIPDGNAAVTINGSWTDNPHSRRGAGSCSRRRRARTSAWSMDFVGDTLASGRIFRTLNIVDDGGRECLEIEVDSGSPANGCAACSTA